jgi:uncharacterized protein YbbK (DUF523 family)
MKYWVLSVMFAGASFSQQIDAEMQRRIWEVQLEQMKGEGVKRQVAERKAQEADLKEFISRVNDYTQAFNAYMEKFLNGVRDEKLRNEMLKAQRRMEDHPGW